MTTLNKQEVPYLVSQDASVQTLSQFPVQYVVLTSAMASKLLDICRDSGCSFAMLDLREITVVSDGAAI
jgi:hypothetical protein